MNQFLSHNCPNSFAYTKEVLDWKFNKNGVCEIEQLGMDVDQNKIHWNQVPRKISIVFTQTESLFISWTLERFLQNDLRWNRIYWTQGRAYIIMHLLNTTSVSTSLRVCKIKHQHTWAPASAALHRNTHTFCYFILLNFSASSNTKIYQSHVFGTQSQSNFSLKIFDFLLLKFTID